MAQNLHDVSNQALVVVLPAALNQVSDKGDVSNPGFVKVGGLGVLVVHEYIRVTLNQIIVLGG